MAKTENNQESVGSENAVAKAPMVNENSNDNSEIVSTAGECILVKTGCTHLKSAININQIRKSLVKNGGFSGLCCVACKTNPINGDKERIEELILCMQCGDCSCTNHVSRHFETSRSEPHVLYITISDWSVKCLNCEVDIPADVSGRLKESIVLLKDFQQKSICLSKNSQNKPKSAVKVSNSELLSSSTAVESTPSSAFAYRNSDTHSSLSVMIGTRPTSSLLPPRGLCNLGNTCFFNSVLQCLARTPFLVETLLEMKEPGEKVTMKLESYVSIEVELKEKWGPVTENLVSTMLQITTFPGNAHTPAHLLDALRSKHRQFLGFNQHDAHELLRTLLDCVKNEDWRRYRIEILRHFGLSRKTNPEEVDEKKKALAKEMDKKLTEIVNVRPDPVFRGFTVSANTCTKCNHKSEIPESFLDLSLPVSFLRLQALSINRRKNDTGEKSKSKHQLKKERKLARKNKKLAKLKKRPAAPDEQKSNKGEKIPTEIKDVNESGYSSAKASSPVQSGSDNAINENNNEILAEALSEINATPLSNPMEGDAADVSGKLVDDGNTNSSGTSHNEVANSSVDPGGNGMLEKRFHSNDAASTSACQLISADRVHHELASNSEPVTVMASPGGPSTSVTELSCNLDGGSSSSAGEEEEEEEDELDDENEDDDNDAGDSAEDDLVEDSIHETRDLCVTLQPQSIGDDEENSIRACLREYTKCEVLTDNNKVVCEKCTQEANKHTSEKKQVYRNITKQLLIKSPPPVLILHLKRFEAKGAFSFRKVDTSISFPLMLDVGSFCSATCERLLYPNQKNILYSLYGIVEHSGSLNAGHYVAYVKVRDVNKHSYRRLFLPKGGHEQTESLNDEHMKQMLNELNNEERQWYYISDSMVRLINEEDVLRKQAYLLFYERIW